MTEFKFKFYILFKDRCKRNLFNNNYHSNSVSKVMNG